MLLFNKIHAIGRVGKINVKLEDDGSVYLVAYSIATERRKNDKATGDKVKITDWFNCVIFGNGAKNFEKYVKVGDLLYIDGEMGFNEYLDKNGENKRDHQIFTAKFQILGSKGTKSGASQRQEDNFGNSVDDDVPF